MKMGEAEKWLLQQLNAIYKEAESNAIATWIFENVTGLPRHERFTRPETPMQAEQLHQLTAIVQRLQAHEPVQYILREAYFYKLKLYVDNNVLIPRPETEELVSWIINDVKAAGKDVFSNSPREADKTRSLKILDVGTGSGCIALALKKEMPKAEIWGCDISNEALNVARRNGALLDIRVDFQSADILDKSQWASLPQLDILVSNPPYIMQKEKAHMQAHVVQHEPHTALFVPDEKPLLFYETLARFGKENLYPGGAVYVEIHEERGRDVVHLFQKAMYQDVQLKQDIQGKNRMVKAIKPLNS